MGWTTGRRAVLLLAGAAALPAQVPAAPPAPPWPDALALLRADAAQPGLLASPWLEREVLNPHLLGPPRPRAPRTLSSPPHLAGGVATAGRLPFPADAAAWRDAVGALGGRLSRVDPTGARAIEAALLALDPGAAWEALAASLGLRPDDVADAAAAWLLLARRATTPARPPAAPAAMPPAPVRAQVATALAANPVMGEWDARRRAGGGLALLAVLLEAGLRQADAGGDAARAELADAVAAAAARRLGTDPRRWVPTTRGLEADGGG